CSYSSLSLLSFPTRRASDLGVTVQVLLAPQEHAQPDQHADAGGAEAVLPAIGLAEETAHQRGEQCAEVDTGIEQREARVTTRIRSEEHTSELQSREKLVCRL